MLTYKERTGQAIDSAKEIEFEILDLDKCSNFFERIGLKAIRRLEKYRHVFEFDDITIDIDTWPKIPTYVEMEGPSVESLEKFCEKIGFDWDKRFDGNARMVFKHYGYDLDNLSTVTFSDFK
jgi:adenylate cyclase, class 2